MSYIPVTVNPNIGDTDLLIMKMVGDRATVREISAAIGRVPSAVQAYLVKLEESELITAPIAPKAHRSRSLTDKGRVLLNANNIG